VSGRLNGGVGMLLKKNKVDVIWGEARFKRAQGHRPAPSRSRDEARGAAQGRARAGSYQAKHIIVATGARPRALPGIEPDKKLIWTYYEAMVPQTMPKSLLVMGSGRHRHRVRLVLPHHGGRGDRGRGHAADPPVEDAEIAALARKRFEKQGIKILTAPR
jgi:dihydrolipoamide dehydrogenase